MSSATAKTRGLTASRCLVAIIVMVPLLAVGTFWYLQVGIVKSSMAAWVAEMVIEHLRLHNGAWPRQWTDLREPFDRCVERSGRSWSFDDLRSRVDVDWEADPKLLARQVDANGQATFRVVYLREGRLDQAVNAEPNQMILDYLRGDQQPNSDALQAEAAR